MDKVTTSNVKHNYVANEWSHVKTLIKSCIETSICSHLQIYILHWPYFFPWHIKMSEIIYLHTFTCQILTWTRDVGTLCFVHTIKRVLRIYLRRQSTLVLL